MTTIRELEAKIKEQDDMLKGMACDHIDATMKRIRAEERLKEYTDRLNSDELQRNVAIAIGSQLNGKFEYFDKPVSVTEQLRCAAEVSIKVIKGVSDEG